MDQGLANSLGRILNVQIVTLLFAGCEGRAPIGQELLDHRGNKVTIIVERSIDGNQTKPRERHPIETA